jgi:hypothetical protein
LDQLEKIAQAVASDRSTSETETQLGPLLVAVEAQFESLARRSWPDFVRDDSNKP